MYIIIFHIIYERRDINKEREEEKLIKERKKN